MSDIPDTRRLLVESAWLGKLARRLVRDPARAEDAVQETLLVLSHGHDAASRPDGSSRQYRSKRWIASVLRNFLRQEHRAQTRRSRSEAKGSKPGVEHSAQEVAATLEIQRRLIEAVQSLDEPYKSVITMRFLESRPPREVARRMGTPVKTVHTRIERGLARLRGKLDRSYKARGEWLSVLAPLTLCSTAPALPGLGVMFMSSSMKWTGSVLGLLALGWVLRSSLSTEPHSLVPEGEESSASTLVGGSPPVEAAPELRVEAEGRSRVAADTRAKSQAPAALTFEGKVTDPLGRPLSGITVRFVPVDAHGAEAGGSVSGPEGASAETEETEERVESDSRGVFEMVLRPERGRLVGRGAGFAPVVSPGMNGSMPGEPPCVVVASERKYSGMVLDEEGKALAGVELAVVLGSDVANRLLPGGFSGIVPVARCRSRDDGRFSFASLGFVEGSILTAERDGYRTRTIDVPSYSRTDLELTLERLVPEGRAVAGRVIDRNGQPVTGASVSAGQFTTITDERGAFVLEFKAQEGDILRAVAKGWLPGSVSLSKLDPAEHRSIVLRLGEAGRKISGTVIDRHGEPVVNAQVWTFDGDPFGFVAQRMGDVEFMISKDVEEMIGGDGHDGRQTHTDSRGRFELTHLAARKYGLFAMHPVTLAVGRADFVLAGTGDASIMIGGEERVAVVSGRVKGYGGEPIVGALIRAGRNIRTVDGASKYRGADHRFYAKTDAAGRFRFAELAIDGTMLVLNGEDVPSPQTITLRDVVDLEKVDFRVPRRCHLRVRLESDRDLAANFALLDAAGKRLNLGFMRGGVTLVAMNVGIEKGTSPLTQTDESARILVLYDKSGNEVRREAIDLEVGKANEIRL